MSKEFEYKVEYETDKETGQISATIPELNYLSDYGDTFAEAEANIKEAVIGYLEVLQMEKREIPKPAIRKEGTYIKILVPSL